MIDTKTVSNNEDINEYFTKTQVLIKASNPRILAGAVDFMADHGIIGDIYFSSSMDYASDCGFRRNKDARALWNKVMNIHFEAKGERVLA